VNIAGGIGKDIDSEIIPNYQDDEALLEMITRYDSHPSILAIKQARQQCSMFKFSDVPMHDAYQLLAKLDIKKATGYDNIPSKLFLRRSIASK